MSDMRQGQALLVVLLVLGVVLTVGLAVVSRSVTEVGISTTQEESTRALEAAEAGVEKSLAGVGSFATAPMSSQASTTLSNNAQVNVGNQNIGGTNTYLLPYNLEAGDVATVDLNGSAPTQLRVCWGDGISTPDPIAEVMIYSRDAASKINMRKWIIGPGFSSPNPGAGCPGVGSGYSSNKDWRPTVIADPIFNWNSETLIMMRVRMLGNTNPQPMAVNLASSTIPVQAVDTISTGTSGSSVKKIRVIRVNPDAPFMFDSALFSGTDLQK